MPTWILDLPGDPEALPRTEDNEAKVGNLVRKGWVVRPAQPVFDPATHQCGWFAGAWVVTALPEAPVPDRVRNNLFRRALRQINKYAAFKNRLQALGADHPVVDDFQHSEYIYRNSIGLNQLATDMNVTQNQLDNLFRLAEKQQQYV